MNGRTAREEPALQSAKDAGIPVVMFDSGVPDAPEESVYPTVATDNYGAVTQSPLERGSVTIDVLFRIASGEEVEDVSTEGRWYDAGNMDDADIAPNLYD